MPELPEVENIARGLRAEILNLHIKKVQIHKPLLYIFIIRMYSLSGKSSL